MPPGRSLLALLLLATAATAQELPKGPAEGRLEFEPDLTLTGPPADPAPSSDLAKLERDLERARRTAASFERLYKSGAGAKVEVERSALKVLLVSRQLAEALLKAAETEVAQATAETRAAATAALELAQQAAKEAATQHEKARLEAAILNLDRWQKLLAFGAARKVDVTRAREQLEALQRERAAGAP